MCRCAFLPESERCVTLDSRDKLAAGGPPETTVRILATSTVWKSLAIFFRSHPQGCGTHCGLLFALGNGFSRKTLVCSKRVLLVQRVGNNGHGFNSRYFFSVTTRVSHCH